VTLVVSPELIVELETVLQRRKFRRFVAAEDAAVLVDAVRTLSVLLTRRPRYPRYA
jgi:predicted nucleic acid-binding protein